MNRRDLMTGAAATATAGVLWARPRAASAQGDDGPREGDRVIVCNEDSQTFSVIDPVRDEVMTTLNLTSFDEDPRPPFRFVTAGVMPTHEGMTEKALYHGAIHIHGGAPSPDQTMSAISGRGSSNIYLIDHPTLAVIGNRPNPLAGPDTVPERITSGVLVGREPHEPTFTRNGREVWVTLRGEDRIAIVDVDQAKRESAGEPVRAVRRYLPTIYGPAQTWFSKDGRVAYVVSQKVAELDVFAVGMDADGFSEPTRLRTIDISKEDPFAFTPFQKISPDGAEMWMSHKIADHLSCRHIMGDHELLDHVHLGEKARPNHVEFVENAGGSVIYASLGRVDDGGPGGVASSRIAVIDRSTAPGRREVATTFFTQGREAHGLWTDPSFSKLYVAHEQDELPGTPNAGQTVTSVFDIADPYVPRFVAQIPLGHLELPSGRLRNKKSINLVYVRPGTALHTG